MSCATAFAPGSIGNVGPGFDVLGLAFDGLGDVVTVELTRGASQVIDIAGRDAGHLPRNPDRNTAAIAANAYLRRSGWRALVTIEKGLPLAGGMGGSAASSVAGAYAAALALGEEPSPNAIIAAALEGEAAVAGRHLDNLAPSTVGGLALSRSVDPVDVVRLPVLVEWWVALVTPAVRIRTRDARAILPASLENQTWIRQMANTAALAHAFASGDGALLGRALDDQFAEPRRASLIPHFQAVKEAAIDAGAFGGSISGSGPTVFAIAPDEAVARACASAMQRAFADVESIAHVGAIAKEGVRRI